MNKTEFIDAVAEKSGLSKKDSKTAVDAVLQKGVAFCGATPFLVKMIDIRCRGVRWTNDRSASRC